jgi:uncharacterized protein (TIGR03118 family)
VTYAVQDSAKHDDVAGPGHGVVNSFDLGGHGLQRLVSPGRTSLLNSPWGVALAPQNFGALAGALLIGNFGDGHIKATIRRPASSSARCTMPNLRKDSKERSLPSMAWRSLRVGGANNGKNGYANALYFTAGPNGEQDGLFGALTPDGLYGTPPYPFPGP